MAKNLTNQKLCERFDNSFNLVNFAIGLAKNLIERGEELNENPVNVVLEAIAEHKEFTLENFKKPEVEETIEVIEVVQE